MSITILHLSDIQYGRHHVDKKSRPPLYPDNNYTPQLEKIIADLEILKNEKVIPNFIVITGDIAEWSIREEYKLAEQFIGGIADYLNLDRRFVLMMPGNHDINRKTCQAARLNAESEGKQFDPPYFKKFKFFAEFFRSFYKTAMFPENVTPYKFSAKQLFVNYPFPDMGVVFTGLNSCIDESEKEPHYGNITLDQLNKAIKSLNESDPDKKLLRIALMHHNFVRLSDNDEENLKDADDLKPLMLNEKIHLILHGHQHFSRHEIVGKGNEIIYVLATGSAGLDSNTIPENCRRYQIIDIKDNLVKIYRRRFDNTQTHVTGKGCWVPDLSPKSGGKLYEEFKMENYFFKTVNTGQTNSIKKQNPSVCNDFTKFVLKSNPAEPPLPPMYTTDGCGFKNVFRECELKPTSCPVFDEELLYLFYGRPYPGEIAISYAPYPVCFLLKPDCIDAAKRIYPFDSRAFKSKRFDNFIYERFSLDDFLINPNQLKPIPYPDTPARIVSTFFGNNYNYYWSKNNKLVKFSSPFEMEAKFYSEIISNKYKSDFDDRRASIEIQIEQKIILSKDTVYAVVLPHGFMDDDNIRETIVSIWDAEPITYHTYISDPVYFTAVIIEKVGDYLMNKGLI
ncbi:MAG: metallophosphoesterase [Desulfobacterales bacterium]|nr:metallophosphoesterase [Desulfobacterales bacterium]